MNVITQIKIRLTLAKRYANVTIEYLEVDFVKPFAFKTRSSICLHSKPLRHATYPNAIIILTSDT
jgi:hypothetical protein